MAKKTKKTTEEVYSDIVVSPLPKKSEDGKELWSKKFYQGEKLVKEEIVTEENI